MLTVAYITSRKDCRIEWFADSLHRECKADYSEIKIVVVDFLERLRPSRWPRNLNPIRWLGPKPTVWQGPSRLTKVDYFAAANATNTAICLAPDGWLACVDDLSVLLPGWLNAVREAMRHNYIVCGAYRKVKDLVVKNGEVVSFTDHPAGVDRRRGDPNRAVPCGGGWFYGCSFAAPVEALLDINGFPEACDGMGYQDSITGKVLENAGYKFRYDQRMMTYESEELHQQLPVMLREDPCRCHPCTNPRDDMSHAMWNTFGNAKRFENYFGPEGIRGLRARVLAGEPFPVVGIPEHRWFDGKPLRELPE